MREAEIAAITEHFFETEFTEEGAVGLLGQAAERQEHEGREWVFLRPDARTLARVDLAIRPPKEGEAIRGEDGELYAAEPFVEELVLVLRGPVPYSRSMFESWFGPGRLAPGPVNEDGQPSVQLEYDYVGTFSGQVIIRWWREPTDPPNMGHPKGPDEVRVEEVHLRRPYPADAEEQEVDAEEIDDAELEEHDGEEGPERTTTNTNAITDAPDDLAAPTMPPTAPQAVRISIDEAMDAGVWLADLAWKVLRQDFTVDRALDLLGLPDGPMGGDGEAIQLVPKDARLSVITVVPRGERVAHAVFYPADEPPLVIAVDALTDRFGSEPSIATGAVSFRLEGTRSRGSVVVRGTELRAGVWAVTGVDLLRN
ncbi:MAG: hypothetical protein JNK05_16265 [Myxococcales bacterium]|nr:hypothetical protein [Myxococcales bacterium]